MATYEAETDEPTEYRALLALAAEVTGVAITADFLERRVFLARLSPG